MSIFLYIIIVVKFKDIFVNDISVNVMFLYIYKSLTKKKVLLFFLSQNGSEKMQQKDVRQLWIKIIFWTVPLCNEGEGGMWRCDTEKFGSFHCNARRGGMWNLTTQ